MNVAIIFAGGTGQRMNSRTIPKQFLELHGKPILVYTLEQFQKHRQIDGIIVVCLEEWIDHCKSLVEHYCLTKVTAITPGGETGQLSIYHGLRKAAELYPKRSVVLIHDGVRPLIDSETISRVIACVQAHGTAITVMPVVETVIMEGEDGVIKSVVDRCLCRTAKAPQGFYLEDILAAHEKALEEGQTDLVDSATLMWRYGYTLHTVEGKRENIKITTPMDFYIFRALTDAQENLQVFGL